MDYDTQHEELLTALRNSIALVFNDEKFIGTFTPMSDVLNVGRDIVSTSEGVNTNQDNTNFVRQE